MGSFDLRITKRTNIKNRTKGNIARTPRTVSTKGVFCHIVSGSLEADCPAAAAFAIISSGLIEKDTKIASTKTARIGNKDAIVTTPNPEREELLCRLRLQCQYPMKALVEPLQAQL